MDTCILINRLVEKKANLEIEGAIEKMGERRDEKRRKRGGGVKNEW